MPYWVTACLDLVAGPILGYCLTLGKLALQAGSLVQFATNEQKQQQQQQQRRQEVDRGSENCNKQGSERVMAPSMDSQETESVQDKAVRTQGLPSNNKAPRKFVGLVIALCGLPVRGKSQVARNLLRRLNWNGETAKVMRVSDYRRKRLERYGSHELFRPDHTANVALRALAQRDAMEDCAAWLAAGNSVAILDGCLVTRAQRAELHEHFAGQLGYRTLFIECRCNDPQLLEANCHEILRWSSDYAGMDRQGAIDDLRLKIAHYEQIYESLTADEGLPRIVFDIATSEIQASKVQGHLETAVLGQLGGMSLKPHTIYFSRHGESEFNVLGKIGGDAVLSSRGEKYAQALASKINSMHIPELRVLTSRLRRTIATARGIEAPQEHVAALNELYAGVCEGLSYEEMQEQFPQEFAWRDQDKLRYRYPWGESYVDTMQRVQPVIVELQQSNNVLLISHQAILRCIIGYFLDKQPEELPYMEVPLHTIIRLTSAGFNYKLEFIKLPVECVNTNRIKPTNCSANRTSDDALITVPAHYDIPDPWRNPGSGPTLVQQH